MPWLISDSNILIDMEVAGLLEDMFRLPETFAVPDVLYEEELMKHHPELPGRGLQVLPMEGEVMIDAQQLRITHKKPGQNDLFALALARSIDCPLLSGDWDLRQAAELEDTTVKGTLWLMGRLYDEGFIGYERALAAYDVMRDEGRRLPWDDVQTQLNSWQP